MGSDSDIKHGDKDRKRLNIDGALAAVAPTVVKIEKLFDRRIVVDKKIFEECLERVRIGIAKSKIDGSQNPNDFKKAGHYAFWLRKLKPFRIFRVEEIVDQVRALGGSCDHNFECIKSPLEKQGAVVDRPRDRYVNELIAVMIAVAFIRGKKVARPRQVQLTSVFLHDLLARLRYDAYTPDNLSILFEAMAQQKR